MITKRIVTQKITIDYNNSYNRSSAVHYDLRTKPSVLSANLCQKSNILIKSDKNKCNINVNKASQQYVIVNINLCPCGML